MGDPELEAANLGEDRYSPGEIKVAGVDEKRTDASPDGWVRPSEWLQRLIDEYGGQHGGESETCQLAAIPIKLLPPSSP
jgi:hypothetical protein